MKANTVNKLLGEIPSTKWTMLNKIPDEEVNSPSKMRRTLMPNGKMRAENPKKTANDNEKKVARRVHMAIARWKTPCLTRMVAVSNG